jgi:outer membrane immunogenic protein
VNIKFYTLLLGTVAALLTAPALAADMPTKAYSPAAVMAPVSSWTGLYVGGGGGYGLYDARQSTTGSGIGFFGVPTLTVNNGDTGGRGAFGTLQLGYDYQFLNQYVVGVFGDYDFSSIKGTLTDQNLGVNYNLKQTSAWAVGGRIGYLVNPQLLTYFAGGYSHSHFEGGPAVNVFAGAPFGTSLPNQSYSGYFLGGGTEIMVAPGWSWKNEYRLASYESRTTANVIGPGAFLAGGGTGLTTTIRPTVQTFRTELVYKFGWTR